MDEQKELQELSPQPACGGCDGCAGCGGGCEAEPVHETVDDALAAELLPIPPADAAEDAEPLPEQVTVVDVRFRTGSKIYYFDPGDLTPKMGDHVIIDTARGPEFGFCAGGCHTVPASDVVTPLRPVLRMATPHDEKIAADNYEKEKKAFSICLQKIEEHKLDMQLVSAECAFDGSKILFFFTADGRVDFRELVKNLASIFRTRIELRQIGVRDKARMVGGLGVCGRPFCCAEFLDDFQPVSIKMAKTQNLSLNPTKISGTCGRLMCCLKYEQEAYEDLHKTGSQSRVLCGHPRWAGHRLRCESSASDRQGPHGGRPRHHQYLPQQRHCRAAQRQGQKDRSPHSQGFGPHLRSVPAQPPLHFTGRTHGSGDHGLHAGSVPQAGRLCRV